MRFKKDAILPSTQEKVMSAGADAGKEESGWIRDLHMLFVVIAEHEHAIE